MSYMSFICALFIRVQVHEGVLKETGEKVAVKVRSTITPPLPLPAPSMPSLTLPLQWSDLLRSKQRILRNAIARAALLVVP